MQQHHLIILIIAIVIVIAIIAVWALAGSSVGSANGKSAAGQALDDAAHEISDVLTEEDGPDGAVAAQIAAADAELHAHAHPLVDTPAEDGKPRIAAAIGDPDDLRKIKGVGPKLHTLLTNMGITRYDQIAAWTAADIAEVDQYLGTFKGRISRDSWIEQAGFLANNDVAGFEAKFGKL